MLYPLGTALKSSQSRKGSTMFLIKLAAVLMVPLALFSSMSAAQEQQSDSLAKFSLPQFRVAQLESNDLAFAFSPEPPTAESSSTSGYVRPVPVPLPAREKSATRPFHSIG